MADGVTLYRDPDYGACAVVERDGMFEVYDHGFMDASPLMRVLQNQATVEEREGRMSKWRPSVHHSIIRANVDRVMRDGGYSDDPLGERAILEVGVEEATEPDLPAATAARVSEIVERAISQKLDTALGSIELPGQVVQGVIEAFARPHTRDSLARPLPFFRARAQVKLADPAKFESAGTCAQWREELAKVVGESLVRATVTAEGDTATFEAAVRPTKEMLEEFEGMALPAFEQRPISGYREVHIQLEAPIKEEELEEIRQRAESCTGATHVEALDQHVILARVPSMVEGHHVTDPAFHERSNWLVNEFKGWGPDMGWVGLMHNKHGQVMECDGTKEPQQLTEARDAAEVAYDALTSDLITRPINDAVRALEGAIQQANRQVQGLKRYGSHYIEAPTLLGGVVLPKLDHLLSVVQDIQQKARRVADG